MRQRRHAGGCFTPGRSARIQLSFDLLPTFRVRGQEGPIDAARRPDDMQHREGERAVGARVKLQMHVGRRRRLVADGIDDDLGDGRLRQPILVHVRRRSRWIGAPDHHAVRAVNGARVEAARRFSVHQLEGHVPRLVAHGIRVDLGRADAVEEAQGEGAGDQRAGSRVVGLQNRSRAVVAADRVETIGDVGKRRVPLDRLEAASAFRPDPLQGTRQANARIAPDPVITNRTFAAQRAPADAVRGIANHIDRAVGRKLHHHAAGIVAIPRAGGADRVGGRHRPSPQDEPLYKLSGVPPALIRKERA